MWRAIAVLQKHVGTPRASRIPTRHWAILAGLPLRPLFLVVACKVLFGVNLYDILSLRWLFVNLLIGAALVPLVLGIAKHFSGRIDRPPFLQRIMDDLAGSNLNAATASLAALAKFSEEAE